MTAPDPLAGIQLPYSAMFVPVVGTFNPSIPEEFRNGPHHQRLIIPPGVSIVQISWSGDNRVVAHHWRDWVSNQIVSIPEGSMGVQRSAVVTLSFEEESWLTVGGIWTDDSVSKMHRVAVTVIPYGTS